MATATKAKAKSGGFEIRTSGSTEKVENALAKSNFGKWLLVTTNHPEKTIRILDDPSGWLLYDRHWPAFGTPGQRHACRLQFGESSCLSCDSGDQSRESTYFRVALIDENGNASRIMLYEPPVTVAKQLIKNFKRRETLLDRDYTVERSGAGKNDTSYTVMAEDKLDRKSEVAKLQKSDPLVIEDEFERLWKEHLAGLSAGGESDDDEPKTTSTGSAGPLDDDDDDDDDVKDDLDLDGVDDDDEPEAETATEEEPAAEPAAVAAASDDVQLSGVFELLDFDEDEGTLHVVQVDTGEEHAAVYYDDDEVTMSFKKGQKLLIEASKDDEGDFVAEVVTLAPAAKKSKAKAK